MIPIRISKAIRVLLVLNLAIFIIQKVSDQFFGTSLTLSLGLVPNALLQGAFWQLITYMFLHADVGHLILNLLMLAFIGSELESVWGLRRFLFFYFFCGAIAGIVYLVLQLLVWQANSPMVGASGGIYGLLLAYGLLFGERVLLFMMLFPMKAKHFIWILAGVEFLTGLFSGAPGAALSSVAHLGGMGGGFVYLYGRGTWLVWSRRQETRRAQRPKKSGKSHLKLVVDREKPASKPDSEDDEPRTWH
ncbi:MAG: rhomboid family intramembrane serine protease [Bdellovibrionales bacterium]|nr:rhomboid family intramembrane serine protease [Bdellovibrionales bacterium]